MHTYVVQVTRRDKNENVLFVCMCAAAAAAWNEKDISSSLFFFLFLLRDMNSIILDIGDAFQTAKWPRQK